MVCHRSQPRSVALSFEERTFGKQSKTRGRPERSPVFLLQLTVAEDRQAQLLVTNWKNSTKIHRWHDSNLNRNTAAFSIIVGRLERARKQSDCLYFLSWSALGASQETFVTQFLITLRTVIDFLSPGVISSWMSCCAVRARNIRDEFCHRDLEGAALRAWCTIA